MKCIKSDLLLVLLIHILSINPILWHMTERLFHFFFFVQMIRLVQVSSSWLLLCSVSAIVFQMPVMHGDILGILDLNFYSDLLFRCWWLLILYLPLLCYFSSFFLKCEIWILTRDVIKADSFNPFILQCCYYSWF